MNEILDMFEINAISKEGHGYKVELACFRDRVAECFQIHMANIGWTQYEYKITSFIPIKSDHITVDYNDTDNR